MSSLLEILQSKLIPWSRRGAAGRFVVARPTMRQADMPSGVQLSPHKIQSKRVLIQNRRCYDNVRNVIAEWPDENLQELGKNMLICTLDGCVNYPLGNYTLGSGKGYFIFVPPGIPSPNGFRVYVDTEKSTFCEILIFLQHPKALECWQSRCQDGTKIQSNNLLFTHDPLVHVFNALMQEMLSDDLPSHNIGEGLLAVFFQMLLREVEEGQFQRMRNKDAGIFRGQPLLNSPSSNFKTRLEHYIQANLRQSLTLEKVAREMYLSPAQFTRNVRRETGQSFNQLLISARLEEAKNLLQNSDWAIYSIAGLTGFRSSSYFCTFFREQTGSTPSEFRHQMSKVSAK